MFYELKKEHTQETLYKLHIKHHKCIMFDTNIFSTITYRLYPDKFKNIPNFKKISLSEQDLVNIKNKFKIYISAYQKKEIEGIYDTDINNTISYFDLSYANDINIFEIFLPFTFFNSDLLSIYYLMLKSMTQSKPSKDHTFDARIATIAILFGIQLITEDKLLTTVAQDIYDSNQDLVNHHQKNEFKIMTINQIFK